MDIGQYGIEATWVRVEPTAFPTIRKQGLGLEDACEWARAYQAQGYDVEVILDGDVVEYFQGPGCIR